MSFFTHYFSQLAELYFIVLGVILALQKRAIINFTPKMAKFRTASL